MFNSGQPLELLDQPTNGQEFLLPYCTGGTPTGFTLTSPASGGPISFLNGSGNLGTINLGGEWVGYLDDGGIITFDIAFGDIVIQGSIYVEFIADAGGGGGGGGGSAPTIIDLNAAGMINGTPIAYGGMGSTTNLTLASFIAGATSYTVLTPGDGTFTATISGGTTLGVVNIFRMGPLSVVVRATNANGDTDVTFLFTVS